MKIDRSATALCALLLVSALVLGACGSSSDNSATRAGVKPADINAKDPAQLRQGGTVRWAVDQFSTQWNYNHINGPETSTATILNGLMPLPFVSDEKARVSVDRDYVTSAKLTGSSPQTVEFKLNPRARWSDGKPITWKDYAAQWKALRRSSGAYQVASSTGYERIGSVRQGSDPYDVIVTFKKPFGEWKALFGPLYPAEYNNDPKKFNTGYLGNIPVTAGPFKLSKIDQTAKTVTIVPDPRWWGAKPKLGAIVTRTLALDSAINAFVSGEVDVADVGPDPSGYKRALGARGGSVREAAGPDFRQFTINGTSPILKDVTVRRALAMAINREAITKADLSGLHAPAVTLDNHFLVNTQTGYQDNAGDLGKYDPGKAKALLDKDGWKLSGGVRRKNGKALELRFIVPGATPVTRQEAELTQSMLHDVGIKLDVVTVPSDPFFDKYIAPGNFDITAFSFLGTPFPASSSQSIYANPTKDAKGELQVQQNFARIGSPAIDALMSQGEETLDPKQSLAKLNQADRLVWNEVHSLTLYQRPQITAVNSKLANVGSFGFVSPQYEQIGFVK